MWGNCMRLYAGLRCAYSTSLNNHEYQSNCLFIVPRENVYTCMHTLNAQINEKYIFFLLPASPSSLSRDVYAIIIIISLLCTVVCI